MGWTLNSAGWWVRTIDGTFVALMRAGQSWIWVGYANGKSLGQFQGLQDAKRRAPGIVRALNDNPE